MSNISRYGSGTVLFVYFTFTIFFMKYLKGVDPAGKKECIRPRMNHHFVVSNDVARLQAAAAKVRGH